MNQPVIYNVFSGEEVEVIEVGRSEKKSDLSGDQGSDYATLRWKGRGGPHFTITLDLFKLCYRRRAAA